MEQFVWAKFAEHGLVDDVLHWDEGWHRCGTSKKPNSKNGAYSLHSDYPQNFACRNYQDGKGGVTYKYKLLDNNEASNMTPAEKKARAERIRREQLKRKAQLAKRRAAAAGKARWILTHFPPAGNDNPYLARKGVPAIEDLCQDKDGRLIIPVYGEAGRLAGRLQSVQMIMADGTKTFLKDGVTAGGYFPLPAKDGSKAGPLLIGEGYATCMSASMATGYAALCAFYANNLENVAQLARAYYPEREIILLADNDCTGKETGVPLPPAQNTGVTRATAAAAAIGAAIAIPPPLDGRRSDFNDVHRAQGLQAVRNAIEAARGAPVCRK